MKLMVLNDIHKIFCDLWTIPIAEDINEVVVGWTKNTQSHDLFQNTRSELGDSSQSTNSAVDDKKCFKGLLSHRVKRTVSTLAKLVADISQGKIYEEDIQQEWTTLLEAAVQFNGSS